MDAYTDVDCTGVVDDKHSTLGYFTFVGGNLVTRRSKQIEYCCTIKFRGRFRGRAFGVCEELWLRLLLRDLGCPPRQPIQLHCYNKGACDIAHNLVQHDHTMHGEVDIFFIKEKLDEKIVELPKIFSEDKLADILTKAISSQVF